MLVHPMLCFPNHLFGDSAFYTINISLSGCIPFANAFSSRLQLNGGIYIASSANNNQNTSEAPSSNAHKVIASIAGKRFMQARGVKTGVVFFRMHRQQIVPLTSSVCVFASEICCLHLSFP